MPPPLHRPTLTVVCPLLARQAQLEAREAALGARGLAAVAMFFLLRSVSQTAPVDEAGIAALGTAQESPTTTSVSAAVAPSITCF